LATNRVHRGAGITLATTVTSPTAPLTGQPVRIGTMTGVALITERSDGTTTVQLDGAWNLPVKGVNGTANSAVAVGDALYFVDAEVGATSGTGYLSKTTASGVFFGWALETVASGSGPNTIKVQKGQQSP
jgi:predicted RecA/RadA family phage recombinase